MPPSSFFYIGYDIGYYDSGSPAFGLRFRLVPTYVFFRISLLLCRCGEYAASRFRSQPSSSFEDIDMSIIQLLRIDCRDFSLKASGFRLVEDSMVKLDRICREANVKLVYVCSYRRNSALTVSPLSRDSASRDFGLDGNLASPTASLFVLLFKDSDGGKSLRRRPFRPSFNAATDNELINLLHCLDPLKVELNRLETRVEVENAARSS